MVTVIHQMHRTPDQADSHAMAWGLIRRLQEGPSKVIAPDDMEYLNVVAGDTNPSGWV